MNFEREDDLTDEDRMVLSRALKLVTAITGVIPDDASVAVVITAIGSLFAAQARMSGDTRDQLEQQLNDLKAGSLYTYDGSTMLDKSRFN